MVGYHVAAHDMTLTYDGATEALKEPPSAGAQRLYKMAWIAALLGFVLRILAFILSIYHYERLSEYLHGDHDIDFIHESNWLNGIMSIAGFISTILMVASIIFVIRGLLIDNNRQRSGAILIGTLKKLEWVAMIALALYLLFLPISYLFWFVSEDSYGVIYMTNAAFIFVSALPLIVAHALYSARP